MLCGAPPFVGVAPPTAGLALKRAKYYDGEWRLPIRVAIRNLFGVWKLFPEQILKPDFFFLFFESFNFQFGFSKILFFFLPRNIFERF